MPHLYYVYKEYKERVNGIKMVALISRARQVGCCCLVEF